MINQQKVRGGMQSFYSSARWFLLAIPIASLFNVIFLLMDQDYYFTFAMEFPCYITAHGFELTVDGVLSSPAPSIAMAVVLCFALAAFWFLSKYHYGWMIAALVLYIADFVFSVKVFGISSLGIMLHIFIISALAVGIINGKRVHRFE